MKRTVKLSLGMSFIMLALVLIAPHLASPKLVLRFLPKDVYEAGKDHPSPSLSKRILCHLLLAMAAAYMVWAYKDVTDGIRRERLSFGEAYKRLLAFWLVEKAFDIVCLDQILCMSTDYYQRCYPETKGCEGWKDRFWNNRNQDANFNFQLNRVVMWGNGDPKQIAGVAKTITDSASWVKALSGLAEKAGKEGRTKQQIGYLRMSEFFMYDSDPEKLKTYMKAKELFYQYYAASIAERGIGRTEVPYGKGMLPVMTAKASGNSRGRILLHGGNDSYIEEFFDAICYYQDHGFDVYLFEGPGQGGCLREQNMKFDPAWEKPVKTILDHFQIDDVTIIGASLGGYLAPRAAAFEKRITKVIGWSIFPDFFDILPADDPKALRVVMDSMYRHGHAGIFNKLYKK